MLELLGAFKDENKIMSYVALDSYDTNNIIILSKSEITKKMANKGEIN